jgi:hypothetical protein
LCGSTPNRGGRRAVELEKATEKKKKKHFFRVEPQRPSHAVLQLLESMMQP